MIEQLLLLNDKKALEKIEAIINESIHRPDLRKFTREEITKRALQSNKDISEGRVHSQEDIERLSKDW